MERWKSHTIIGRFLSKSFLVTLIVLLVLALNAQAQSAQHDKLPPINICNDRGSCILVEIAITPEEWATGLMFRDRLPKGTGMLFLFPRPDFWSFWMKNVKIPLDIIWMDNTKRIVHIVTNAKPCLIDACPEYTPMKKAIYVLESNSGLAKKWKLKIGDRLIFQLPK